MVDARRKEAFRVERGQHNPTISLCCKCTASTLVKAILNRNNRCVTATTPAPDEQSRVAMDDPSRRRGGTPFVAFAGNIGVGKTTVATRLAHELGLDLRLESVDDNPYLARFYADMLTWALPLNMYFLGTRSRQILEATTAARPSICDRTLYEDRLFVQQAYVDGTTSAENVATFDHLFGVLEQLLPPPCLLVYLSAPTDVLAARIRTRGRVFERDIDRDFLDRMQQRYEHWITGYNSSPVLRIETSTLDLGRNSLPTRVIAAVAEALD